MEKLPLRCQNKPACSALLPPIWNMAAHRLRVRKQKTTVKAFQKLFCCIFITSPGFRRVKFLLRASENSGALHFVKSIVDFSCDSKAIFQMYFCFLCRIMI